ncbi:MAG: nucleoside phosphorylase [Oscillibacter sp.]|jgi:uridine phosphorylase|nr:nucleoside phosphorylase [Oscillibacter sp.]
MKQEAFPILEFDDDKNVVIRPAHMFKPIDIPKRCVLCNFGEAIEKMLEEYPHRLLTYFEAESIKLPVYELEYQGKKIALAQAYVGAPGAAVQIEVLTALGCCKYIACGGCGVLQKDIAIGHFIIPTAAVRDEGTSYHYVKPAREIVANERVVNVIENTFAQHGIPYMKAKTWTTDAFYRETPAKIQQRIREGCVTVDMEASAYMAAAQYDNVDFGQILYAGDNLAGTKWDRRNWDSQTSIRENTLRITLDACVSM